MCIKWKAAVEPHVSDDEIEEAIEGSEVSSGSAADAGGVTSSHANLCGGG